LVLGGLRATPARFRVRAVRAGRRSGGSRLRFSLTRAAKITLSIRPAARCAGGSAKTRRCRARTLTLHGRAGSNRLTLSGRVAGKALPVGRFLAAVVAVDARGVRSAPVGLRFTVLR
ncbi:MAG: hypothetical protein JWO02_4603, partial [Solirubrobacterales bacterium]|nr:hypothetical protein [Solirubrobacterales bacterium]